MKRYRVDRLADGPVEVECAQRGHPHCDADGKVQYINSHFDSALEAWDYVVGALDALSVNLAERRAEARAQLAHETERLANVAERLVAAKKARDEVRRG
ncbi:MAG: hypothetical protein HOW73_43445 [Polyangiaceae bacterium]|nr:hypothetical protein [Polyangiaceae bacterium]